MFNKKVRYFVLSDLSRDQECEIESCHEHYYCFLFDSYISKYIHKLLVDQGKWWFYSEEEKKYFSKNPFGRTLLPIIETIQHIETYAENSTGIYEFYMIPILNHLKNGNSIHFEMYEEREYL